MALSKSRFDPDYLRRLYILGKQEAKRQGWAGDELHIAGLIYVAQFTQPHSRARMAFEKVET